MRTQKNGRGGAPAQANPTDAPASAGEAASATTTAAAGTTATATATERVAAGVVGAVAGKPAGFAWRDAIRTVSAGAVNAA